MNYSRKVVLKAYGKFILRCTAAVLGIAAVTTAGILSAVHFNSFKGQGGLETPGPVEELPADLTQKLTPELAQELLEDTEAPVPGQKNAGLLSYTSYRVKKGDMIGFIADEFGVTQDTIISVNNIHSSRLIQIGQYLKIPSEPGILYTVRNDGETPSTIAAKYKVNPERCASLNGLELNASLSAGRTLFVPDAELDWVTRQEINGDLFKKPLHSRYYFSSMYGWRSSPFDSTRRTFHSGIDMACARGTSIYAALDGTVSTTGWSDVYGNYVIIRHHSGYKTLYAHMSQILVTKGQHVSTATRIGRVGSTGMSTGPHLHFTVYKNGRTVNPANLWK